MRSNPGSTSPAPSSPTRTLPSRPQGSGDLYDRVWAGKPSSANDYVISADEKTSIQARLLVVSQISSTERTAASGPRWRGVDISAHRSSLRTSLVLVEDDVSAQLLGLRAGAPDFGVPRVLRLQLHAHFGATWAWRLQGRTSWLLPTTVMPDSVTVKPRARSSSWLTPILTPSGTMTFLSMMARWIVALPPICT